MKKKNCEFCGNSESEIVSFGKHKICFDCAKEYDQNIEKIKSQMQDALHDLDLKYFTKLAGVTSNAAQVDWRELPLLVSADEVTKAYCNLHNYKKCEECGEHFAPDTVKQDTCNICIELEAELEAEYEKTRE